MKIKPKILKKIKEIYINTGSRKKRFETFKMEAQEKYKKLNGDKNITILSPNCIAGEIYSILGLKFNSPTINCSITRAGFINFCLNLDEYLKVEPYISGHNGVHPILTLESKNLERIDMRFVHDDNDKTVIENWNKRKKRIIKDNMFIIMDNKDEKGEELPDELVKKINNVNTKKSIIFVSTKKDFENTFLITKKQAKKYNYKKLNGLYGFQEFFDYVDFFTRK